MLRAALTIGGTLAGIAALLSFKTHPATSATEATAPSSTAAASATATGAASTGATSGKTSGGGRTFTGKVINTNYGPMQVQITLSGQKITTVKVLQQTNDGTNSQQIDSNAIPKLNNETLTAQSARIDAVSGASYTSSGYIQSLQSALDEAKA